MNLQFHRRRLRAQSGWFDRGQWSACGLLLATLLITVGRGLAGTGTPAALPTSDFAPRLNNSVYQPTSIRDPFLAAGTSVAPVGTKPAAEPTTFHLDGFLGSSNRLAAIVNGWVLSLNKPMVVETANGKLEIKAVQITFAGVILEVGGKRIELKRTADSGTLSAAH